MPFNFTVDYTPDPKPCKGCKKDMEKDSIRFGSAAIYDEKSNTVGSSMYRHIECAPRDKVIQLLKLSKWNSNTVLKGWDSLTSDDKETVTSKLNEIKSNEEEKKTSKKGKKRATGGKKKSCCKERFAQIEKGNIIFHFYGRETSVGQREQS